MSRSSDLPSRLWEYFIGAIVLLVFLQFALALLGALVHALVRSVAAALGGASILLLAALLGLAGAILVGLVVRVRETISRHEPQAAQRSEARAEAARQHRRVPAEGVPVHHPRRQLVDPDPALQIGEES